MREYIGRRIRRSLAGLGLALAGCAGPNYERNANDSTAGGLAAKTTGLAVSSKSPVGGALFGLLGEALYTNANNQSHFRSGGGKVGREPIVYPARTTDKNGDQLIGWDEIQPEGFFHARDLASIIGENFPPKTLMTVEITDEQTNKILIGEKETKKNGAFIIKVCTGDYPGRGRVKNMVKVYQHGKFLSEMTFYYWVDYSK